MGPAASPAGSTPTSPSLAVPSAWRPATRGRRKRTADEDLGWTMGRIHTSGHIPARGLEVEIEWTVIGDGIEDCVRERAGDLVRRPGPLHRFAQAARRIGLD